jgi:hypothetical protein
MPYAAKTDVPVERTKVEIERMVVGKHGAEAYLIGHQTNPPRVMIQFKMCDRIIRFELPLPALDERRGQREKVEQATRSRWRALWLIIKAKLEAVDNGVTTFEEEFLAHIVMPGDRTVASYVIPKIGEAYTSGKMPLMLPQFAGDTEGER